MGIEKAVLWWTFEVTLSPLVSITSVLWPILPPLGRYSRLLPLYLVLLARVLPYLSLYLNLLLQRSYCCFLLSTAAVAVPATSAD